MKYLNKICGLGLIAFLIMLAAPNKSHAQEGGYVSDQEFYDELDPYGTWVDDPTYGNVWIPDAEDGFRPYASRGHWVVTDYGNTWVSDYPWGWATFHYGRWRYDDYYGWEWIPGHEWAPAWVSWRRGGGYYGWAPLTPGISISLSFGNSYSVPDSYWTCAPQAYIGRPNIYNYYVPHTRVVNIIHQTTIINNTYVYNKRTYVTGPRITEIRRVTKENVRVYKVGNASRNTGNTTITNNTLNIYRPQIRKTADARPARVVNGNEYRKEHPTDGIANRQGGQATINRNNAARLAAVAKSNNEKLVKVNHDRPAATARPTQPGNTTRPGQPNVRPAQPGARPTPVQGDNKRPDQNTRPAQGGSAPAVQPGARPTRQPNNAQANEQDKVRLQQEQAKQKQEQARQHGQQQTDQAKQQQAQQRQQLQEQAKQKQQEGRQAAQQQQVQQRQQQQEQARQQQAQQRQQQQEQAKQQQVQQRQQQQEQAKQQQVQQRQQQQEQAKQQQAQQRQQQQEQAKQQQAQQRQQQADQAKQQQAQQRQQQQEQVKQQQAQQAQQRQQQAQQARQQQAQQRQQQQQQQKQEQEKRPAARPANQ